MGGFAFFIIGWFVERGCTVRDDFSKQVKETLAKRVAYFCSNPTCRKLTIGPSVITKDKTTNIGVAAHICAASPGGPRFDATMSTEKRKAIENGIWLCQNCAHLIDTNSKLFTVEMLKGWKENAENEVLAGITTKFKEAEPTISIEVRNRIIGAARCIKEQGNCICDNYSGHRVGYIYDTDIAVYNICVNIVNAKKTISQLEFLNHMQLHTLNLDGLIFEIVNSLPEFYDEKTDGTGSSLVVTVYDYIQFFNSKKGKKLLKKCVEFIEIMEKI